MEFHEISELDQKSLQKQHIEKSELLNIIYYDFASQFCKCVNIFADFCRFLQITPHLEHGDRLSSIVHPIYGERPQTVYARVSKLVVHIPIVE